MEANEIICIACHKITQDWAWKQGEEGKCFDCVYEQYGEVNPKKKKEEKNGKHE